MVVPECARARHGLGLRLSPVGVKQERRVGVGTLNEQTVDMPTNEPARKAAFSVLMGHAGCVGDAWQMMLSFILGAQYDLNFSSFGDDCGFELGHQDELLSLVKKQRFDLSMVYSYLRLPEERKVLASIKAQFGKPIIVSNMGALAPSMAHEAGVDVFLPMSFTVDDLRKALVKCGVRTHNGALRNHDKPRA